MADVKSDVKLALLGGEKAITIDPGDILAWPIVTQEDEAAVLEVLRAGAMSGTEITKQFEKEFAEWMGMDYALGCCNGTASLLAATWACGVGAGDEIIAPSMTYWASATPALMLGAAVNFADIERDTLCIDPNDIEHRIGPRTKAIVPVHYAGHPADMDPIMKIADRHNIKVIEDVSHAHGALYKGRMVGTIGHVACMSMMAGKAFAAGEAGMMVTNDHRLYERCISFGHYQRTGMAMTYRTADSQVTANELLEFAGVPLGGAKHRMNQTCSAMGRVQLKHYPERMAEIQKAMNHFWDLLEGVSGIRAHRPAKDSGSTMGGWYTARGLYRSDELGGLPCSRFCEAVRAEVYDSCWPGANGALHLHPVFHKADIFNMGKPTMISFGQRDVRQGPGTLPNSESIGEIAFGVPWFKRYRPEVIEQHAAVYRKVAENYKELL